jgi:hypothetical protein
MSFTLLPWDTWGVYHCIDLFSIDPYWRWRWFDTHGLQIGNVRDKPWNNQSYTLWQLKMTNVGQQLEDHSSLTSPWLPAWEPGVQSRRSFERPTDWYHAAAGTKRGSTWQHQVMVGWCPKIASWRRSTLVAVTDASRSGALRCPKLMTHLAVACWVVAKTQISRAPACWQEIETPSQTLRLRISAGRIPSATCHERRNPTGIFFHAHIDMSFWPAVRLTFRSRDDQPVAFKPVRVLRNGLRWNEFRQASQPDDLNGTVEKKSKRRTSFARREKSRQNWRQKLESTGTHDPQSW